MAPSHVNCRTHGSEGHRACGLPSALSGLIMSLDSLPSPCPSLRGAACPALGQLKGPFLQDASRLPPAQGDPATSLSPQTPGPNFGCPAGSILRWVESGPVSLSPHGLHGGRSNEGLRLDLDRVTEFTGPLTGPGSRQPRLPAVSTTCTRCFFIALISCESL